MSASFKHYQIYRAHCIHVYVVLHQRDVNAQLVLYFNKIYECCTRMSTNLYFKSYSV